MGVVPKTDNPSSKKCYPKKRTEVVPKSDHLVPESGKVVPKKVGGWSENDRGVVPKSVTQETDQETVQETAALRGPASEVSAGADAVYLDLVRKLMANGVGRSVAEDLARTDPDACRRCLEYLPFAEIKKTKGAFLANAIRDGYGPPKGYEEASRKAPRRENGRVNPNERSERRPDGGNVADLLARYETIRNSDPDRFASYLDFQKSEKRKIQKIARQLSPDRGSQIVSEWESEERQMAIFERWLGLS